MSLEEIVYIADPKVLGISISECSEPLIDLKHQTTLQYGPPPENEFTAPCYTKVRKTVYDKLCKAQDDLPDGWYFRLYEGFRSLDVQKMLFDQEYERVVARYPHKQHAELFKETTRLISPVINLDGSMNIPPHNTGGAVDVEIINEDGYLIDMGMEAKDWINVHPDLCLLDYQGISAKAKQNRKILFQVMSAHGFINYPTEWWHFSFGDRYWAYCSKKPHAFYGPADNIVVQNEALS